MEKKKRKKEKKLGMLTQRKSKPVQSGFVLDSRCLARCPIFKTKYML